MNDAPAAVTFLSSIDQYHSPRLAPHVCIFDADDPHHSIDRHGIQTIPGTPAARKTIEHELARQLAGRFLSVDAQAVQLRSDVHGRLAVSIGGSDGRNVPDLNLSRSGRFIAIGITLRGRIGVDLEIIKPEPDFSAAQIAFTLDERNWLASVPALEKAIAFYKCWTAKEAFVKAVGYGVSFGLEQVETECHSNGTLRLARISGSRELARGWSLSHHQLTVGGESLLVAMCAASLTGRARASAIFCNY